MNENQEDFVCKYCGSKKTNGHAKGMCGKCRDKYPVVQELIQLFSVIKEARKNV